MSNTTTWHISASGKPARCKAKRQVCPLAHFTPEEKTRVTDAPVSDSGSRYGSFVPAEELKDRVEDETELRTAVATKNFASFFAVSERKKRKQAEAELQKNINEVSQNYYLLRLNLKQYKVIEQDAEASREQTQSLKLDIQKKLQDPEWEENSAEYLSMLYTKSLNEVNGLEKIGKTSNPFIKMTSEYQRNYMLSMISDFAERSSYNSEGKKVLDYSRIEKTIASRVSTDGKILELEEAQAESHLKYGSLFGSERTDNDTVRSFRSMAKDKGVRLMSRLSQESHEPDTKWGTYRNKITLSDLPATK